MRHGHNSKLLIFILNSTLASSKHYILLILDLFSQFYSYSIPLFDTIKLIIVQLQILYEIHVLTMGLS